MSADAAIETFREQLGGYMASTRRGEQTSTLFDLPLRSVLGGVCFYENLPELLSGLDDPPDAIGARMRRLGSRPYGMHLNSMMFGFLTGLEERRASGRDAPADEDGRIERTVGFWQAAFATYREGGSDFSSGRQRVLDEELLAEQLAALGAAEGRHPLARELALLQSLNFLLHGESRDGLFDHGPYDERPDSCVVVKELTDLRGGLHAWAEPSGAAALPIDRAISIRRLRVPSSALHFDMFGTMSSPGIQEFGATITHELIVAGADGDGELVPIEELASAAELHAQIRSVNRALLGRFATMPADERITYGADMYANMLVAFGRIGARESQAWELEARRRFTASGARALERMRGNTAANEAWARSGGTPQEAR